VTVTPTRTHPELRFVRTTCPRDCYDSCGIVVAVGGGLRTRVLGDREHPVSRGHLCRKCSVGYNGVFLDHSARLTQPLRRVGPKSAPRFEECSWEAATDLIAERVGDVIDRLGAAAVLNTHYTGTMAVLGYGFGQRLFNRIGATEIDPDTICNNAGHVALGYMYGTSNVGFDPRAAADASSILVWGANPSASAPHQHEYWLPEAPGAVIVVDPLRTPTAAAADLHLALRPGTDAALAFAIAHVLEREGRWDREFLDAHSVGWRELLPAVRASTPEWAERTTGVEAGLIERAARLFGDGPSLLWIGQGLQRQPFGGNVVRAVAMLPALAGWIGLPGGGLLYLNGTETRGIDDDYVTGAHLAAGERAVLSQMDLAATLEDPDRAGALFCWNINIAASNPQQARLRRAMRREDLFTVAIDLFATDTTDLADVVLPAASFLESDDLVVPYFHQSLSAQVAALTPPGQAQPNPEVFRRIAAGMGFTEPELFEPDRSVIDVLLERTGLGVDFEKLSEVGTIWPEPVVQFADREFPTPSGRIELASAAAEAAGLPRVPEPMADPPPSPGRLRLLSPASHWALNTEFGNDGQVVRRSGPLTVTLNPVDAAALGLTDGAVAVVTSTEGSLTAKVATSDDVPIAVALIPKGRWPKLEPGGSNVNVLNPGDRTDMGESSAVHAIEVTVRQAESGAAAGAAAEGAAADLPTSARGTTSSDRR
jgi:anaerobic selenocysteine-containing dehydrogenase